MAQQPRYLIVTGDDFGYCESRNKGIVECFKKGSITRASVMVNAVATENAFQLAKQHNIPIGLHLNLTEGEPVSKESPTSLCGEGGGMRGKHGTREALDKGLLNANEIISEIRAQIQRFKDLSGHLPLYVDGHHHIHVLPGRVLQVPRLDKRQMPYCLRDCDIAQGVREHLASCLSEFDVLETRMPAELNLDRCTWIEPASRLHFYQDVVAHSAGSMDVYSAEDVRFPDAFVGMATMGSDMTLSRLQQCLLAALESSTSCELMCHVGYRSVPGVGGVGEGPDEFSCSSDREHEMDVICHPELARFYAQNNVKLISSVCKIGVT